MSDNVVFLSLPQIVAKGKYPFTMGQLRSFMLKRQENGLDFATIKIGKRLYLREDLFDKWVNSMIERK